VIRDGEKSERILKMIDEDEDIADPRAGGGEPARRAGVRW
jgi:hypothetical protein